MTAVVLILGAWTAVSVIVCLTLGWVLRGSKAAATRLHRTAQATDVAPVPEAAATEADFRAPVVSVS